MTLNAISLVCATVVINVKKKGDLKYCPDVPDPVMNFCRNVLGRLMCTRFISYHKYYGYCEQTIDSSQMPAADKSITCEESTNSQTKVFKSTISELTTRSSNCTNGEELGSYVNSQAAFDAERRVKYGHAEFLKNPEKRTSDAGGKEEAQTPRDPRHQWYFVAEVLDKTLFFIFLLTMLTTVFVSLVVIPFVHS